MRIKSTLSLITFLLFLSGFTYLTDNEHSNKNTNTHSYNIRLVHILKAKKGNKLGDVYIEDFKNDIFKRLLITIVKAGKIDTLYFINECQFINPKGVNMQYPKENFNGYKIDSFTDDSIQLFGLGKNSVGASDPIVIKWNIKKRLFEIFYTSE
jgi:hypothetical protein